MKFNKAISLLLLSIYSIVLLHDIIPHHHHDNVVSFGFNTPCCEEHNNDSYSQLAEIHSDECNDIHIGNSICSCHLNNNHKHNHSSKHHNCKSFKVQLSKYFAFDFGFNYSFEQECPTYKLLVINQDAPELSKQHPIRRRGPPAHV